MLKISVFFTATYEFYLFIDCPKGDDTTVIIREFNHEKNPFTLINTTWKFRGREVRYLFQYCWCLQ